MAFTEQRVLNQVTILIEQSAVNVQWLDQVLRDGEVIASTPFRKAYSSTQKAEFAADMAHPESYFAILGW